jgi:hypothetical protein
MGTHQSDTAIQIAAPPARVWRLLTDLPRMAAWNPFIRSISGDLVVGGRLAVEIMPPGRSAMRFTPTVLTVRPERELRWLGRVLVPGIFDGEHYFLLHPIGAGTLFTQGERFSGLLVGFVERTLTATEAGFEAMNAALKELAETPPEMTEAM